MHLRNSKCWHGIRIGGAPCFENSLQVSHEAKNWFRWRSRLRLITSQMRLVGIGRPRYCKTKPVLAVKVRWTGVSLITDCTDTYTITSGEFRPEWSSRSVYVYMYESNQQAAITLFLSWDVSHVHTLCHNWFILSCQTEARAPWALPRSAYRLNTWPGGVGYSKSEECGTQGHA